MRFPSRLGVALVAAPSARARSLVLEASAADRRRGAGRHLAPAAAPSALNVVVVTLDTTRADRLGCYGFRGVETPNIDAPRPRRRGLRPRDRHRPAHVPVALLDLHGPRAAAPRRARQRRLLPGRGAGDARGAAARGGLRDRRLRRRLGARAKWGLAQGFDEYSDKFDLSKYKVVSLGTVQKPGDEVMDGALAWLESVKQRRFFAWVHLYDPHSPYDRPSPSPRAIRASRTSARSPTPTRWSAGSRLAARAGAPRADARGAHRRPRREPRRPRRVDPRLLRLRRHDPRAARGPDPVGPAGRRSLQTSSVDLMPTLLDLLGLAPQPGIDGHSLAREILDPPASATGSRTPRPISRATTSAGSTCARSAAAQYKYIDAPEPELYDLAQDPGETRNIYRGFSRRAEGLRLRLEQLRSTRAGRRPSARAWTPRRCSGSRRSATSAT